jgi:hypothetical protein
MIKDNSLGDRLNAVKQGKPLPNPPAQHQSVYMHPQNYPQNQEQTVLTLKKYLISRGISLADSFIASFIYGFAIKTLFNLDWTILGAFAVGFLLNHSISIFPRILFPKFFK